MFTKSTQRQYWMHDSPDELVRSRIEANKSNNNILTPEEELQLVRFYLARLREFCSTFQPTMRKSATATAFMYMKRFYLNQSCSDYHPRDIGVTCAYLACKVDEFNVSIDQFIKNVGGDKNKAQMTVLTNEMLLMKKLRFHLAVHLPYRAMEGFLIDLRARYPPARDKTHSMMEEIDDFLEKSMYTDACFLFTPSQIALSAVCHGAKKCRVDLSAYLNDLIFSKHPEAYDNFQTVCVRLDKMIEDDLQNNPNKGTIKKIEKKLLSLTAQ